MRRFAAFVSLFAICVGTAVAQSGYPYTQVPFTSVKITPNTFWGDRIQAAREVTIPLAFSKCESEHRYKNFEMAAYTLQHPGHAGLKTPEWDVAKFMGFSFDDTDVYKTIEGASYVLQTYPDAKLKQYIDSVLDVVGAAQEPDGYLYTARTINPEHPHGWAANKRWAAEEHASHELYNLGHMVEGAIAHYQATGSRKFLDIAIRYADVVCKEVGPNPGQACVVPGHQIAEMALAKLYLVTGDKKYLDEAKFFLDYRGKTTIVHDYSQAHKPVIEQDEAVGHAVRAAYMYAGMADVAALTGDQDYVKAIDAIWDNIVTKKLYITGGIGATSNGEAFGKNYELPNMSAYCETCAAIGNVYVNYRLFLLHGDSKYYDVLERTLYNGLISGVSLEGNGFFYPNPLESMGQHQRQAWFGCACCPSNICRFIPSLPGYIYAVKGHDVYLNLFLSNSATLDVAGKKVALTQTTNYPWEGETKVVIDKNTVGDFNLKVRIPGWLRNKVVPSDLYQYTDGKRLGYSFIINGITVPLLISPDGYINIERRWKKGDELIICFDMEPRTVRANNKVAADRGMISVERGPLVYCAEHPDNNFDIMGALINQNPQFRLGKSEIAGTPIQTLITDAQTLNFNKQGKLQASDQTLTLIPYYAWCHRGSGKMRVWLPQDLNATNPSQPATLASESKVSSSTERMPALSAINDRLVPKDENDRSVPYTHWWPKNGTTEWLGYEFPAESTVQSATVYWYDDGPWGGCRVPQSWRILYQDAQGQWQPVSGADDYPTEKGSACTVNFNPVKTKAMRLEIVLPDDNSAGLFEWIVK